MRDAATSAGNHDPKALHAKYLEERDKRAGGKTGRQYLAAEGDLADFASDP